MKKLSYPLFLLGIVMVFNSLKVSWTGATIGTGIKITNMSFFFLGLVFLSVSVILYIKGKSLEAIVIPTGGDRWNEKRVRSAMKDYSGREEKPYVLITGNIGRDKKNRVNKRTQQYKIYKELREKYRLQPKNIIIEGKSKDTLENFFYSLKKLKKEKVNHLAIATDRTQYWRFKIFAREARNEGLIDESFRIRPIYTRESWREFIYGSLAFVKDYFRVKYFGSLEKAMKHRTGGIGSLVKKGIKKFT